MSIETTSTGVLMIIAVMTFVTLLTRFGGPFLMSYVTISPRIESFINTMASSVLIAILTPMACLSTFKSSHTTVWSGLSQNTRLLTDAQS